MITSNSISDTTNEAPQREPEIIAHLARLEKESQVLGELLGTLDSRVTGMVASSPTPSPEPNSLEGGPSTLTEVGTRLAGVVDNIRSYNRGVTDLLDRLEV